MLQLYKNIKQRRLELGMTQSDLAKKLCYADKSMIAKIEKGLVDLTQSKIIAFAEALDISPGDLMGWDDKDNIIEEYNDNIEYLSKNYPNLVDLYNEIHSNEQLVILFDKAKKLEPQDLAQILKIIDTFNKETK